MKWEPSLAMLLPNKGHEEEGEKAGKIDGGDMLPGTARHREFYPKGVANILKGERILSGKNGYNKSDMFHLYMYDVKCVNIGFLRDPFLTEASDFFVLFSNELDAELASLKSFHLRLISVVLDVDVEPSTTPWDSVETFVCASDWRQAC